VVATKVRKMLKPKYFVSARCTPAVVLLTMAFCVPSRAADPCDASALPQEIQTKLDKNYPDWQPEKLENLDDEDRKLWTNAHPNDCPGIAIGHFESKNELSYALLLVSKPDRRRQGFRVVAFTRSGPSATYIPHLVTKWNDGLYYYNSDEVIATVPPGRYAEAMGPKNVQTDLDSILCETLEKGAAVYYWKNGHYHELITSE
jgi:hypothetical protein